MALVACSHFNIRVYGLWVRHGKVLITEEPYGSHMITKFPGGGLELGEGIQDALEREWQEEFYANVTLKSLYYINPMLVPSAFDQSQVIAIYYLVESDFNENTQQQLAFNYCWVDINTFDTERLSMPIDRLVMQRLKDDYDCCPS